MNLRAGERLGPYQIVAPLGAGGMGEVYRARDTRLERSVAIKILPAEFSQDERLRIRFEREAKAISSLAHPHICTVHDFGREGSVDYLVMELLEGETLASKLERGALPIEQVLRYGAEIGGALEQAHKHGIVHRDLKPSNIMITKSGAKLLDFGLAKSRPILEAGKLSQSPTADRSLTGDGKLIGTLAYMAPEQVEGKEADHRTDIFALGAVLYQMTTGKRAFSGDSEASLIAAILRETPRPIRDLQPITPPALQHLIEKCLSKDPDDRWQSAHDIAEQLHWITRTSAQTEGAVGRSKRWYVVVGIAVAAIGALATSLLQRRSTIPDRTARPGRLQQLTFEDWYERTPSVSPDGHSFVYTSRMSGRDRDVFLQRMGGRNAVNLTESCTTDDSAPAFSPDGLRIAYRSSCTPGIFIMGATGESRRHISDIGVDPAWSPDGQQLVVATRGKDEETRSELWRIDLRNLSRTKIPTESAVQPSWSPDGRWIAYSSNAGAARGEALRAVSVDGKRSHEVFTSESRLDRPIWSRDGKFLYFISDAETEPSTNIWRIRMDPSTAMAVERPERLTTHIGDIDGISITADGKRLVFSAGRTTYQLDRFPLDPLTLRLNGERSTVLGTTRRLISGAPSPNNKWLALQIDDPRPAVFTANADGSGLRRLTDDAFENTVPMWTADSKTILFLSNRGGVDDVWKIDLDGGGLQRMTNNSSGAKLLWFLPSPDDRRLLVGGASYDQCAGVVEMDKPISARNVRWLPPVSQGQTFDGSGWSPDGTRIVGISKFWPTFGQSLSVYSPAGMPIYVYDLRTGKYQAVMNGPLNAALAWVALAWVDEDRLLLLNLSPPQVKVFDMHRNTLEPAFFLSGPSTHGGYFHLSHDRRAAYMAQWQSEANIFTLELADVSN